MASKSSSSDTLAGRYAAALFEIADGAKQLDQVADDLRGMKQAVSDSEDLARLLRSPVLSREAQAKAMASVCAKAGVSDTVSKFVAVVATNRRLFALPAMIDAYLADLARRRGEMTAEVVSAQALSAEQEQALSAALQKSVGGKVSVESRVDPSLLGGMVVRIGSKMIDSSLKTKLQKLQFAMKGAQ